MEKYIIFQSINVSYLGPQTTPVQTELDADDDCHGKSNSEAGISSEDGDASCSEDSDDESSNIEYVSLGVFPQNASQANSLFAAEFQTNVHQYQQSGTLAKRRDVFKIVLVEHSSTPDQHTPASEALQRALQAKGFDYERRRMLVGDYLLIAKAQVDYGSLKKGCEFVFGDIVKRSQVEDFGVEIKDKSILEQKRHLKLARFRKIHWIVEGDIEKTRLHCIPLSQLRLAISSMAIRDGIIVENFATPADTISYLIQLAEHTTMDWLSESANEKPGLRSYSELLAICARFRRDDPCVAFFWMLQMIPSIGVREAIALVSVYTSYAELIMAYQHTAPSERPTMLEKLFLHTMEPDPERARTISERIFSGIFCS